MPTSSAARPVLQTHAALSLLNFLDPNIVGFNAFTSRSSAGGPELRWNVNVRHELTPFGSDTGLNGFFELGPLKLFATLHGYFDQAHFFPGVSAELIRWPLRISDIFAPDLSLRAAAWVQPKDQLYATGSPAPGGLVALRLGHRVLRVLEPYIEWQAKSAGWVAGDVSLVPKASMRLGLAATLFR